jgi:hypothetical protein
MRIPYTSLAPFFALGCALLLLVSEGVAATLSVKTDGSGDFASIQACAQRAQAGDTCLVFAGNYPEFVQTVHHGSVANRITFKAQGEAQVKGFRIMHQYITLDGFKISKLATGLNPGSITVEPEGDFCEIKNNKIVDGTFLHSFNFYFDAATKTIRSADGNFVQAGFEPGTRIYIASNINSLIKNHDQVRTVKSVTANTLTLVDTDSIQSEGPVLSFIYAIVAGNHRDGVMGIAFTISSARGAAENCHIHHNILSNLGGKAMTIMGSRHLIERNTIEKVNGWEVFFLVGNNNTLRYNYIRQSDRPEGFEIPNGELDQSTGLYWDFVHPIMTIFGSSSIESGNNVFEYNFIQDMVSEFVNINERHPTQTTGPARRFIFRNNVITGLERHGAFHIPETIITNNTFYRAAYGSATRGVFSIAGTALGSADDSIIKNNAFVESNVAAQDSGGQMGWYALENVNMAEAPNYNFVAGAGPLFPGKRRFEGVELNGINGGDPKFTNRNNPVGPDGIPFTNDDGLIPLADSPLCRGGENGGYIGAYACAGNGGDFPRSPPSAPLRLRTPS